MTIAKFRERCIDLNINRGYKLQDVTVYISPLQEVQIAAVWHNIDYVFKIEMPI